MVSYIIPQYVEGIGNCTKIADSTGEHILNVTIRSAFKSVCREKLIDMRFAKKKAAKLLGQSNLIPIYIGRDEIYMPVRVRTPKAERDGGYGYVNFTMIDKIMDKQIALKDGGILPYIDSRRNLMKRYKMALRLKDSFTENQDIMPDFERDLKSPATREDIALLLVEISRLKRVIESIT